MTSVLKGDVDGWMLMHWCSRWRRAVQLQFFHSQLFTNSVLLALRETSEKQPSVLFWENWTQIRWERMEYNHKYLFFLPLFHPHSCKNTPAVKSFQAPAHYRLCGVRHLSLRCDSWPAVQRWSTGEAVTYWFSLKSRNGAPASFLPNVHKTRMGQDRRCNCERNVQKTIHNMPEHQQGSEQCYFHDCIVFAVHEQEVKVFQS